MDLIDYRLSMMIKNFEFQNLAGSMIDIPPDTFSRSFGLWEDIIFIDYLNICASARIKAGGSVNSYTYIKSIAEELRGLAVDYDATSTSNANPDMAHARRTGRPVQCSDNAAPAQSR